MTTQRYRKFKCAWGMWYAFDTVTGNSESLKTRVKSEAEQKVNAMNETERQPSISLGLARVYLNATDPKLATRTSGGNECPIMCNRWFHSSLRMAARNEIIM